MKLPGISVYALSLICANLAVTAHAHSDEIKCDTTYVVEKADSLSNISAWAYGTTQEVENLHQRNRLIIGPDPGSLAVGMELFIPCLDEPVTVNAEGETSATAETAEPASGDGTN